MLVKPRDSRRVFASPSVKLFAPVMGALAFAVLPSVVLTAGLLGPVAAGAAGAAAGARAGGADGCVACWPYALPISRAVVAMVMTKLECIVASPRLDEDKTHR